ncbi:RDD family protein [uncultured Pontibacter sp.]|uniref:RDD family protein n=1 Tax=uncultured Pontibacter sp. TaxID=453356 RepID=UPI00262A5279|nr:RDD family protein [uncultured Pontibacter sp.]
MQLSYQKTETEEHVASLGTRALAGFLDLLLLLTIIGLIEYYTVSSDEEAFLLKVERILHLMLGWLYFAGAESSVWRATIGKHLLQLKVSSTSGKRISFRCASLRYLLKPISVFVLLMQAISQTSTTAYTRLFHDRVCDTKVTDY